MKNLMKLLLACICVIAVTTSCGSDNDGNGKDVELLTPDDNKKELERIGTDLLSRIDPSDHADLLKTLAKFEELDPFNEVPQPMNEMLKSISTICSNTDLGEMLSLSSTRAMSASDIPYGTYIYDKTTRTWILQPNATPGSLEYKFEVDGKNAVIKGNYSDETLDGGIPTSLNLSVTLGGNALAQLNSVIEAGEVEAKVNSSLDANGYRFGVTAEIQRTGASVANVTLTKHSETLIAFSATGNTAFNEEIPVKDIKTELKVLNDLSVTLSCSKVGECMARLNALDYDSTKDEYQACANFINQNLSSELRYVRSDYVVAKIAYDVYQDGNYWDMEPLIIFSQDGSKYSFDEYFESVEFENLYNKLAQLMDRFGQIL